MFIHLEKTYDRTPREILKWALMRKEVHKNYLKKI
jgi:hypothetical protein